MSEDDDGPMTRCLGCGAEDSFSGCCGECSDVFCTRCGECSDVFCTRCGAGNDQVEVVG